MDTRFYIKPIGKVKREGSTTLLTINNEYKSALLGLEDFSHVYVFLWADHFDDPENRSVLQTPLPYAEGVHAGVFACRSPLRPNPILSSLCKICTVHRDQGIVIVNDIDAFDETPIIDLKPYYPITDRVQHAQTPAFLQDWPEWFPEEGIGLMPHER